MVVIFHTCDRYYFLDKAIAFFIFQRNYLRAKLKMATLSVSIMAGSIMLQGFVRRQHKSQLTN
ncbi:MAG: hypothetical protein AAGE84_19100 [Cyanobacteria bacterium P01_G01_bin.39]